MSSQRTAIRKAVERMSKCWWRDWRAMPGWSLSLRSPAIWFNDASPVATELSRETRWLKLYRPHAVALDHVLPRSVVPELAARFFNLEAIDASGNLAKITAREMALARGWHREGLLSSEGLRAVEAAVE